MDKMDGDSGTEGLTAQRAVNNCNFCFVSIPLVSFTVELLFFTDHIGTAVGTHGTETTAVLLRQDIAGRDECCINEISTVIKGVCRNKGGLCSIDPANIIITEFADDKAIAAKGGNTVGQNIGIQRT